MKNTAVPMSDISIISASFQRINVVIRNAVTASSPNDIENHIIEINGLITKTSSYAQEYEKLSLHRLMI
jgi:hypothetical protein